MADITPIAHIETPFAEKFGVPFCLSTMSICSI